MSAKARVLIVGAGPTGLVLALWLTRLKVPVRIIDSAAEPGTTSRALAVQARTLELYQQMGIAQSFMEHGHRASAVNLWVQGKRRAHAEFGALGRGLSPFPYVMLLPQDVHERLLIERLGALGIAVERRVECVGVEQSPQQVTARLRFDAGREEVVEADYVAGCDGGHSAVRKALGVEFEGGTYEKLFYVADVQAGGAVADGNLHVALDTADFVAVFPCKAPGALRLVGTMREQAGRPRQDLTWDDVSGQVLQWLPVGIERVNWFSTYKVHHRVAAKFQRGRVFLAGDAAHVHSPVGGQGMNTGLGDAINLAWKLAAVLDSRAPVSILDSYEPERIAFARRLVRTTDRGFTVVTSSGKLARFMRLEVFPAVVPWLVKLPALRRLMFRTVSQIQVNYRAGPLSVGRAGRVCAGDRLPWLDFGDDADNYAPLVSIDWQVHVYGSANAVLEALCRERGLALHAFSWRSSMGQAGLKRDAIYLVRPDGYVGFAGGREECDALERYLDKQSIAKRGAA